MEDLRDRLYPGPIPYHVTNYQAWEDIVTSEDSKFLEHPLVPDFREMVVNLFPWDKKKDDPDMETDLAKIKERALDLFLITVRELYGNILSDKAAHKVSFHGVKIPKTQEEIIAAFESIGVVPDDTRIRVPELMLKPMPPPIIRRRTSRTMSRSTQDPTHRSHFNKPNNKQNGKGKWNKNRKQSQYKFLLYCTLYTRDCKARLLLTSMKQSDCVFLIYKKSFCAKGRQEEESNYVLFLE
jgi:hypothetical protein